MKPDDRANHLQQAKTRALEYVADGDLKSAVASMVSDLCNHDAWDQTFISAMTVLGMFEIREGPGAVRHWIEGFN